MDELTTWGEVPEWCVAFKIKPEWIVGWVLWTSEVPYPGKKYSSKDWDADDIASDDKVQGLKIFHVRPEEYMGARGGTETRIYSYGMTGRDIYWLPGASRPKFGIYVSDEDDAKFFDDLMREQWDGH